MLWKALHNLLLGRAQTEEGISRALDVVNQLSEKGLISSVQHEEARKALNQKALSQK